MREEYITGPRETAAVMLLVPILRICGGSAVHWP